MRSRVSILECIFGVQINIARSGCRGGRTEVAVIVARILFRVVDDEIGTLIKVIEAAAAAADSLTEEAAKEKTRKGKSKGGNQGQKVTKMAERSNAIAVPKQIRREH